MLRTDFGTRTQSLWRGAPAGARYMYIFDGWDASAEVLVAGVLHVVLPVGN